MRRSLRTSLVVVGSVFSAALMTFNTAGAQQNPPPSPPPPPMMGTPVIGTPIPTKPVKVAPAFHPLTSAQKKQILAIAKKDKNVSKLLKGRHYKTSVTIWVTPAAKLQGGVVSIKFSGPQTMSGTFVDLAYNCTGTSYKQLTYTGKFRSVVNLTVSVDLKHKKVVGIKPFGVAVKVVYKNPRAVPTATPGACHS